MIYRRTLFFFGFVLCTLSWNFAPARAMPIEGYAYSHLVFTAERMQDQLPLPASKKGQRPIADMAKTKFRATIDLYFAPGHPNTSAFARARYNVRAGDHSWQEVDSGFQSVKFHTAEAYQRIAEGASAVSDVGGPLRPGVLDYSETPMPKDAMIASAMQITGSIMDFLSAAQRLLEENVLKQTTAPVLEMHIAIPQDQFTQAQGEFKTQSRLSFESYDMVNRPRSIFYRKMLYGTAKVTPLNDEESTELAHLLTLEQTACEEVVENPGNRKN